MKRTINFLMLVVLALAGGLHPATAVASSRTNVKKTVKVGDFNKIEVYTGIKVIYLQGKATGEAQISTTESAAPYIRVEVKNKTLNVFYAKNDKGKNRTINGETVVTVQAPVLNGVETYSAGAVVCKGDVNVKGKFNARLYSAGSLTIPGVRATEVDIETASAASLNIERVETSKLNIEASSASKINMGDVLVPTLDIEATSASSVNIRNFSGKNLKTECSSTSSVKVNTTDATTLNLEATSMSSIYVGGLNATMVDATAYTQSKITLDGNVKNMNQNINSQGKITFNRNTLTHNSSTSWSSSSSSGSKRSSKSTSKTSPRASKKKPVPTQAP